MNNKNIVEIYLEAVSTNHLIQKQHVAVKTIKAYRDRLSLFIKHIGEKPLKDVTTKDIKAYLADCVIKGIEPATLKARLSVIKGMFKELSDPDHNLEINDVANCIKSIKKKYSRKDAITKDDLTRMAEHLESRNLRSDSDMRNHLFFQILKFYGFRVSSVLGIQASDIHFESMGIRIHYTGKGNLKRSKLMPLRGPDGHLIEQVSQFKKDLKKWVRIFVHGPIFRTKDGEPWVYQHAYRFFKKMRDICGFSGKGYTIHSMKHSFVSHKLSDGVPLQTVSSLADHSSTFVTASIYSNAEEDDENNGMTSGLF